MVTLYDHIQQLRAELRTTDDRGEQRQIEAELTEAMAAQAALDRRFEAELAAVTAMATAPG